jgi:putative membrane protein
MGDLGIFLRGILMGAADVVPGVSGGTMALITGIYHTLLRSISSIDLYAARCVLQGQWREAWRHVNGRFLCVLVAGIGVSIISLAQVILWTMAHYPLPLWSLFFGLIAASALVLQRQVGEYDLWTFVLLLIAAMFAGSFVFWVPADITVAPWMYFGAGFVAICAMILPGVSGSLLLLLIGMYQPVLVALRQFDVVSVGLFLLGAAAGITSFSRVLNYLLKHKRRSTVAVLTGFLWGSLVMVWPWRSADAVPVSPFHYTLAEPSIVLCVSCALVGVALVIVLQSRWGHEHGLS